MQKYRVECNYGSRYFVDKDRALAFFRRKIARNLDVELWLVSYQYSTSFNRFFATQELLEYSSSNMPKC